VSGVASQIFLTSFDVRDLALISARNGNVVLAANHRGPLQAFTVGR
jgi:hypothetical protein